MQQPAQYQAPAYTPQPTAQPAAPAPAPTTRSAKPQHQPQAQAPNFPPMEEDDLPFKNVNNQPISKLITLGLFKINNK